MTDRERITQIEEVVSEILQKQDRLSEDFNYLTMKVASNSLDILSLKKSINSLESKVDRLESKSDRLESKSDRLESKADNHSQMIMELQHDVRAGQAELKNGIEAILKIVQGNK